MLSIQLRSQHVGVLTPQLEWFNSINLCGCPLSAMQ